MQEAEKEKKIIFAKLISKGCETIDLSENELAKTHIRFMVMAGTLKETNDYDRFEFRDRELYWEIPYPFGG